MKTKIKYWIFILLLFGVNIYQFRINTQELALKRTVASNAITNLRASPKNEAFPDRFDRGNLIQKVSRGEKNAAFELATYYDRKRLPEAAFYWFGVAIKLGHKGMSKEGFEFYERTIIGEFEK